MTANAAKTAVSGTRAGIGTEVPASLSTFLAFDFGLKRTGVAVGNRLTRAATPQATIRAEGDARWPHVAGRIAEWQPDALVVGVPFHPDGASHDNTARAQRLRASCAGASGCPCSRSTSATPPPRPWRAARAMPTPPQPPSSWSNS